MHQCLGVQEILSGIVKNLERNDALQLALSSKNFLGPSMDHLWRDISSFEPLIACLPSDIWEGKIVSLEGNADSFTVILHPRYSIKSEHLHRYVKLYAPRIRSFSLDIFEEMKIPSIEALQALELATARQQGALSPLLTKFTWYDAKAAAGILGADFSANLAPRMHLFLGQHIEVLKASDLNANDPLLHKASMDLAFNCFANTLKHMTLGMYGVRVNEIVKSFSWNRLESACLFFPSLATVLSLASLPCLEVLVILGFSVENDFNGPSKSPPPTPYQALRYLACHSDSFHDIRPFLDRFPTRNALQTLTLGEYRHSSSLTEVQNLIGAIGHLCDPSSFTSLNVWCRTHCDPVTEPLEISFPDHIDLAPLYKFRNMKTLYLSLAHSVTLTPDIITQIPVVWPQLETLALCEQFPTTCNPSITLEHVLQLASGLPSLRELGLLFDATKTVRPLQSGSESFPKLRALKVGRSPIRSPAYVTTFLRNHFPHLEALDIGSSELSGEGTLYKRRWELVLEGWKAYRNQQ